MTTKKIQVSVACLRFFNRFEWLLEKCTDETQISREFVSACWSFSSFRQGLGRSWNCQSPEPPRRLIWGPFLARVVDKLYKLYNVSSLSHFAFSSASSQSSACLDHMVLTSTTHRTTYKIAPWFRNCRYNLKTGPYIIKLLGMSWSAPSKPWFVFRRICGGSRIRRWNL